MIRLYFAALIYLSFSVPSWGAKLIIKSQPEGAEIYINTNGKPVRIGVTPYEADLGEVIKNYVKSNSFLLELKKSGHNPYRLLIAKTEDVDLELTANLELDKAVSNIKQHDALFNFKRKPISRRS